MSGSYTGLDLESFLLLTQADLGAWALLGLGTLILGLLAWLSWGLRWALRSARRFRSWPMRDLSCMQHRAFGVPAPSARLRDRASRTSGRFASPPIATRPERPGSGQPETGSRAEHGLPGRWRPSASVPSLDLATGPIRLSDPDRNLLRSEVR